MPAYSYGIGKGLREPCFPFREAIFFGAELNAAYAGGWNCIPTIIGYTTSFDLSTISPSHEVVVAKIGISDALAGDYAVNFKWYRDRDSKLLYEFSFETTSLAKGWLYGYSYIGYVDWEINENGNYHVLITVTGALSFSKEISFTVSGIPIEPTPEPAPIGAMGWIIARFANASAFFYSAYLEALGWIYPFWLIAEFFYALSQVFIDLSQDFYDFNEWVNDVARKIANIPDLWSIWQLILAYVPNIEQIRDWFYGWWSNVTSVITEWWTSTMVEVQGWIAEAKQDVLSLVNTFETLLASLQAAWDDFKSRIPTLDGVIYWWRNWTGNVLSIVNTWWTGALLEVQGLIDSAFTVRQGLWDGWQDWRDKVTEFFSDPEEWLYKAVDRIIERFW